MKQGPRSVAALHNTSHNTSTSSIKGSCKTRSATVAATDSERLTPCTTVKEDAPVLPGTIYMLSDTWLTKLQHDPMLQSSKRRCDTDAERQWSLAQH
jgi:hypothetical protein